MFRNNIFNKEFQDYFNKSSNFKKQLIMWSALGNQECPKEYLDDFLIILEFSYDPIKETKLALGLYENYRPTKIERLKRLKRTTKKSIDKLDNDFEEIDGTLLKDIVYRYMKTHKIF